MRRAEEKSMDAPEKTKKSFFQLLVDGFLREILLG